MSRRLSSCLILSTILFAAGCDATRPTATGTAVLTGALAVRASQATVDVTQFDLYQTADFYLTCVDEMTHWEGPTHVTAWTVTTGNGPVISKFRVEVAPEFFIERPNGTRYYAGASAGQMATIIEGPIAVNSVTARGTFKSADGDVLPTTVHFQLALRGGEVFVEKFVGACP